MVAWAAPIWFIVTFFASGGRRRRGTSLYQPLGDESVVERLAGAGALGTKIVIAAVQSDDRLARSFVLAVFEKSVNETGHGASLPKFGAKR